MFRPRENVESGHGGPSAGAAALTLDLALDCAASSKFQLVHDLAQDIGSMRWFRGLGAMLGLGIAALSFWPDFSAVEAATALSPDGAVRDEYRSQMILPLALGGDSGRRMGGSAAVRPLAAVPERPMVRLTATLGQGDSFGRMLQRAGVGAGDAERAAALVATALPLAEIEAGTRFDIMLGKRNAAGAPRPLDRLDFRARFDLALGIERRGGALLLDRRPIAVSTVPLRIRGTVGNGLYRSARAVGAPAKAIQDYLRLIDQHVSLEGDVAMTDQFDMVVAYRRSAEGEGRVGELLYAGFERDGKPRVELVRWGKDGQFHEASGMGKPRAAGMVGPVAGRMTSGYGMRRHPILGYARMHAGVDFGAPWGAPIFAVTDGTVSFAGWHGGHGKYVRLNHGGGLASGYAHMSRIAVASGAQVRAGQVIGYVGSTGLSTGPHLHYELYRDGRTVNPLSVRFTVASAAPVDKKELAAFKARLAELKSLKPGAALQSLTPKQAAITASASGASF